MPAPCQKDARKISGSEGRKLSDLVFTGTVGGSGSGEIMSGGVSGSVGRRGSGRRESSGSLSGGLIGDQYLGSGMLRSGLLGAPSMDSSRYTNYIYIYRITLL